MDPSLTFIASNPLKSAETPTSSSMPTSWHFKANKVIYPSINVLSLKGSKVPSRIK